MKPVFRRCHIFSNSFRDFYGMSPSRYVELNRDSGQPPLKAVDDKEEP